MAKQISSLNVVLGATVAPFVSAFSSLKGVVSNFTSSIGSAGATLAKFTGLGAAIGAIAGGAGLGLLLHQQLEAIDVNAKLSDRLGVSTEALAGLQHAASLAGVSSEQLTGGLEKMLKNLGGGAIGDEGKKFTAAMDSMGLSAEALANMSSDDAFATFADKLSAIQNPAERAATAVAIFGKSGQELLPLLMSGAAGIKAASDEAKALGLSFSRVDAAKVEAANDAVTRMESALTGVVRQVAIALSPFIQSAADAATRWGIKIVAAVQTYLPMVVDIFSKIFSFAASIWDSIYNYVAPVVQQIYQVISDNFWAAYTEEVKIWDSIFTLISTIAGGVWDVIRTIWGAAMDFLGVSATDSSNTVAGVFQTIQKWSLWFADAVSTSLLTVSYGFQHWSDLVELVAARVALFVVRTGNQIAYVFTDVIPALLSWFANNWQDIFTDVFNFTGTVLTNLASNIVNIFSNIPELISGSVSFSDLWKPLTDGFESSIKELPKIADREAGPLEKALSDQADALSDSFGQGLGDYLAAHQQKVEDTVNATKDALNKASAATVVKPAKPEVAGINEALDGVKKKAKDTADALKLVTSGSAESQKNRYLASLGGGPSGSPAAAPLAAGAGQALRDSGKDSSGSAKQMFDLVTYISVTLERFRKQDQDNSSNIAVANFA